MLHMRRLVRSTSGCVRIPAQYAFSTRSASDADFEHCLDVLKHHDLERTYLQMAFVPRELRASFVALRSLNAELALIADKSAESTVLKMRFDWWRRSVEKTFAGNPPSHSVLCLLHDACVSVPNRVSVDWIQMMIRAREDDASKKTRDTVKELEAYCERTYGAMQCASLEAAGASGDAILDAAGHAGMAVGMAICLRSFVHHFRRGRYVIPVQLAKEYGLKMHQSHTEEQSKALSQCFFVLCDVVSQHLEHAKGGWSSLTAAQKMLFQDCVYARHVISHLKRNGYNPFLADASNATARLPLQILLAKCALKSKLLRDATW